MKNTTGRTWRIRSRFKKDSRV